jgi:hypothetical protein
MIQENYKAQKKIARVAGLLYFILAITGAYGIMYVPSSIIVMNDSAATTSNIIANEFLFRTGIFSNLVCQTTFIFLALALYNLFKEVSEKLAKMMVALVIVSVPIAFLIIFNQLLILITLKEGFMTSFEAIQQQSMAMIFLKMYNQGNVVIGIFWGLWLIPFGLLAYRSIFIHKIVGVLLVIGGISYVVDASVFVLVPAFHPTTATLVAIFGSVSELSAVLWLLIVGVRERSA